MKIKYTLLFLVFLLSGNIYASAVNYTYDNLGRLVEATYSNGNKILYQYDASGNRKVVAINSNTTSQPGENNANTKNILNLMSVLELVLDDD